MPTRAITAPLIRAHAWLRCAAASVTVLIVCGCGGAAKLESLLPAETFHWVRQPIAFSPPSSQWERQGDNGGGTLGVRFILRGGGGQCISIAAYRQLAERDRRDPLARLISRRDSLTRHEFLRELSLARPRTDSPISGREAAAAFGINESLDRATTNYLAGSTGFALVDLEAALRRASQYEPTLDEILPHIRLRPDRMQEPLRWKIGYERDTVVAGMPAFAGNDTLITPEDTLLYHEVIWVVRGCGFKATFQGRPENLASFHRVVDTIQFPEPDGASPR